MKRKINKKLIYLIIIYGVVRILSLYNVKIPYLEEREASGYVGSRENEVVKAVRIVSPAVVNISSEYEIYARTNPFSGFAMDPFFDSFFKDFFDRGAERRYKKQSLGSGVIIDGKRGFILTNAHVITKTGKITVLLMDERELEAQIVGADPDSDLAVLRVSSSKPLPSIEMGDSGDMMIGETVIAIGNPFGFSNTVTTGVISAVNRSIRAEDREYHDFIQTDASINPGNSGGPLLNINGELIGINTAIYAKAQGIGFAIPINKAKRIISDLIQHGEVIPAWIGLTVQNIDERLSQYLSHSQDEYAAGGALVKKVEKNSPADKAGILEGDMILSIGDKNIRTSEDYHSIMKDFASGDTLKIEILRNGKNMSMSLTAILFPPELAASLAYDLFGIKVENISPSRIPDSQIRGRRMPLPDEGAVISEIRRDAYLARIGVRPGDIIRQIDETAVKNTKDFEKAVIKYRNKASVVILVQRGGQGYYITVRL